MIARGRDAPGVPALRRRTDGTRPSPAAGGAKCAWSVVALALVLAGCGNKGPLSLPQSSPPAPAAAPAPVRPPTAPGADTAPSGTRPGAAASAAGGAPPGTPAAAPTDRDVGPGVPFPPR